MLMQPFRSESWEIFSYNDCNRPLISFFLKQLQVVWTLTKRKRLHLEAERSRSKGPGTQKHAVQSECLIWMQRVQQIWLDQSGYKNGEVFISAKLHNSSIPFWIKTSLTNNTPKIREGASRVERSVKSTALFCSEFLPDLMQLSVPHFFPSPTPPQVGRTTCT